MKKKRILITGGAGFLGSHLCKRCIDLGHEVICIDNLSTGFENHLEPLFASGRFTFHKQDVTSPYFFEVEEIYNFACPASPKYYQKDPLHTIKTNVYGMLHACELAKKNRAILIQASTSEVYGDPLEHPQTESYLGNVNCFGKRACYDEGKRLAETILFEYVQRHNIDGKIARIFNTYGPNMHPDDGRVVSNFIIQSLQNKPLTIYGEGSQTRSFCFVEDLLDGIFALADKKEFLGPVNLGNPFEISILELAKEVIRLTNSSSKIVFFNLPENDPKLRNPDITLAKASLGFAPKISLEEGLLKTIRYFDKVLSQVV